MLLPLSCLKRYFLKYYKYWVSLCSIIRIKSFPLSCQSKSNVPSILEPSLNKDKFFKVFFQICMVIKILTFKRMSSQASQRCLYTKKNHRVTLVIEKCLRHFCVAGWFLVFKFCPSCSLWLCSKWESSIIIIVAFLMRTNNEFNQKCFGMNRQQSLISTMTDCLWQQLFLDCLIETWIFLTLKVFYWYKINLIYFFL